MGFPPAKKRLKYITNTYFPYLKSNTPTAQTMEKGTQSHIHS